MLMPIFHSWAPMFPSETPDDEEDTEFFKIVVAKRLSPSEASSDPLLDSLVNLDGTLPSKRKRNLMEDEDPEEPYVVPEVGYAERW